MHFNTMIILHIIGALCVVVGLYVIFSTVIYDNFFKLDTSYWQEMLGIIVDKKIKCIDADDKPGPRRGIGLYVVSIKYKYAISGIDYVSRWKNFRQAEINVRFDEEVDFVFSDYKIGDTIEIIYDPKHPKRARLTSELPRRPSSGSTILGLLIEGLGLYLLNK
jgi:hypothetical protein